VAPAGHSGWDSLEDQGFRTLPRGKLSWFDGCRFEFSHFGVFLIEFSSVFPG